MKFDSLPQMNPNWILINETGNGMIAAMEYYDNSNEMKLIKLNVANCGMKLFISWMSWNAVWIH